MKKLLRPNISGHESYDTCVSGVEAGDLKNRFVACHDTIDERTNEYINHANAGTLSSLAPLICRRNEDPIVIGNVLKSELVKLYDYYMVQRQPARGIYDAILVAANDKCPFCGGIGRPKSLDHYLPKANYPQFSVFPHNLVPACRDCNTGKSNCNQSQGMKFRWRHKSISAKVLPMRRCHGRGALSNTRAEASCR